MPGPGSYWIGQEEIKEVMDVLESGHLSRYGDLEDKNFKRKVYTLEKQYAQYCGVDYALVTSSGTSAIMISLLAMGLPIHLWPLTAQQFSPAWCRSWLRLMKVSTSIRRI